MAKRSKSIQKILNGIHIQENTSTDTYWAVYRGLTFTVARQLIKDSQFSDETIRDTFLRLSGLEQKVRADVAGPRRPGDDLSQAWEQAAKRFDDHDDARREALLNEWLKTVPVEDLAIADQMNRRHALDSMSALTKAGDSLHEAYDKVMQQPRDYEEIREQVEALAAQRRADRAQSGVWEPMTWTGDDAQRAAEQFKAAKPITYTGVAYQDPPTPEPPPQDSANWQKITQAYQDGMAANYDPEEIGDILFVLVKELLGEQVPE